MSGTNAGAIQSIGVAAVALGPRVELGRAAEDQPLAGPRHRHVEQAPLLLLLGAARSLADRVVVERRDRAPRCRLRPAAARAASRHARSASDRGGTADRGRGRRRTRRRTRAPWRGGSSSAAPRRAPRSRPAPRSRDRRRDRRRAPRRGRGARPASRNPCRSRPGDGLPLAPEAHQLAHVREPAAPAGQAPAPPGRSRSARSRARSAPRRRSGRPRGARARTTARTPASLPSRSSAASSSRAPAAEQHEPVERDPAQRRAQRRVQRLLVARVGERPQVADERRPPGVRPVAAPADHIGRHARVLQRPLVDAQVGARARQQHDVARRACRLSISSRTRARERARLGDPPRRREPVRSSQSAALVDDQQLHQRRVAGACGSARPGASGLK